MGGACWGGGEGAVVGYCFGEEEGAEEEEEGFCSGGGIRLVYGFILSMERFWEMERTFPRKSFC